MTFLSLNPTGIFHFILFDFSAIFDTVNTPLFTKHLLVSVGLFLVAVTLYLPDFHPISLATTFFLLASFYFSTWNLNIRISWLFPGLLHQWVIYCCITSKFCGVNLADILFVHDSVGQQIGSGLAEGFSCSCLWSLRQQKSSNSKLRPGWSNMNLWTCAVVSDGCWLNLPLIVT